MNSINIIIYNDILNENDQINSYKSQDSFKYILEDSENHIPLSDVSVKEIELIRYSKENDYDFDKTFNEIANNTIITSEKTVIALITDSDIKPLSRIRSYKGILSRELKESSKYIEEEVIMINNESIIGCLIIVDEKNIDFILNNYFGSSNTCCFFQFQSDKNFRSTFLKNLLQRHMVHNKLSTINYFSLYNILKKDESIIRIGGDGYDRVSIQIFSLK